MTTNIRNLEISVVIPVYNGEHCLNELYEGLIKSLESITNKFEIIFVEDCGGDNSWEVISNLAEKDERVKGIKLSRNFGQHAATICGISRSCGQWIVSIDDDLEQNPQDIPHLYDKALEGYDLVYGIYSERSHARWRNVTSSIARKIFNIAIPSLNYNYTSFRIIRRNIAKTLTKYDSPFPFIDGYLSWVTNNYSTYLVQHNERKFGTSNYSFKKLVKHTLNIFVTFSELPLKIVSWMGIMFFLIGICWLVAIVIGRFIGGITVSGYASLLASVLVFGGTQMLTLGVIGEYISRINFKTSRKPLFLVSKEIN